MRHVAFYNNNRNNNNNNDDNFMNSHSTIALTCPEKNGRFPLGNRCDTYLECVVSLLLPFTHELWHKNVSFQDGVGEEKVCPDGLRFNEKASLFTYPCQYPIDVDCGARTLLQVRKFIA